MKRHCKPSIERRRFEQATLKRFTALGLTPAELKKCRLLLIKGRKRHTDDFCTALNKDAQEKAGIQFLERCPKGDPPDSIIFRIRPVPNETCCG